MAFRWHPKDYARFAGHRQRAALDLLTHVGHENPQLVHDVGCGRGEMARLMAERWPAATVIGSDLSAEMLEAAAAEPSPVKWRQIDVSTWDPDAAYDVLYANAVFHWVLDHDQLLSRLMAALAPDGVLAFQVPLSWGEPINALMREVLGDHPVLAHLHQELPPLGWYYDLMAPLSESLEMWETTYLQVLRGDDPVLEWSKGAALRPVLGALEGEELDSFLSTYAAALRDAYPRRPDGTTLLPFPRRFVVATK